MLEQRDAKVGGAAFGSVPHLFTAWTCGLVLSKTKQFALEEVEIAVATIDLEDVRAFRNMVARWL